MRNASLAVFFVALTALPAAAGSITIDSTNCNSAAGCYGLSWTLDVESGSFDGGLYSYSATLTVGDDPLVSGTSVQTISAVSFKASDSVGTNEIVSAPTGGPWVTTANNLSSNGCTGSGSGFICSSTTGTEAITGSTPLRWVWYFNTTDTTVGEPGDTMHIGAKMTTLSPFVPGKLLSASASVPEPTSLSLLGIGLLGLAGAVRRRINRIKK